LFIGNYFLLLKILAILDFFLDAFLFLITPTFVHLSITLYMLLRSSIATVSHF
jgi:hypothetical protein